MNAAEPRIFRATIEAWIGHLLLPMLFLNGLVITAVNLGILSPWLGALLITLITGIFALQYLRPMLRNWIKMDDRAVEGFVNGRYFQVYWGEILAARIRPEGQRSWILWVARRNDTLEIPLRFFDQRAVWDEVLENVAQEVVEDARVWSYIQRDMYLAGRGIQENEQHVVPDPWAAQVFGWSGVMFCLYAAVRAGSQGSVELALGLVMTAGIFFLMLINWGITEVNEAAVVRHTLFGSRSVAWEDIKRIEYDRLLFRIVLIGEHQQLAIPGPGLVRGGARRSMVQLIWEEADKRCIPIHATLLSLFKFTRTLRRPS